MLSASDLPQELVIKIFSYLPLRDLVSMSRVCTKWYELSRVPELWRKVNVSVAENKVIQFCKFMAGFKLVEIFWFQIIWKDHYYHQNKKPVVKSNVLNALSTMISNWTKLKCLRLSQDIALLVFPDSLKHIMYCPVHPPYHNVDNVKNENVIAIASHNNIDEVRICHVYLARYTNVSINILLTKKATVLKCLSIDCYQLDTECLTLLGQCTELTKLSLHNCIRLCKHSLTAIFSLKFLKFLNLDEICNFSDKMCTVLESSSFLSLEWLLLSHCESVSTQCFILMKKKMPKLETFGVNACKVARNDVLGFLTGYSSLKNIAFDASVVEDIFLTELAALIGHQTFDSICLCDIGCGFEEDVHSRLKYYIEEHFHCKICLFKYPNPYFVCNCF